MARRKRGGSAEKLAAGDQFEAARNRVASGGDRPIAPTHWSFGQLANLVGTPATYLRGLPAPLAGINLQYGLTSHRAEQIKTLEIEEGRVELRAVTGPDYGRYLNSQAVSPAFH